MPKPTMTLAQLTNKARGEFVRVKVVDKQPKQESSSRVSYQRIVLVDEPGTKLTATLFGVDIGVYSEILLRGKIYDIRNMVVKEVPPRFASYPGEKQLHFTNSTEVLPAEDEGETSVTVSPYTSLQQIPADASTDDRFDMIVYVLAVHPEKLVPKGGSLHPVREISITDSSGDDIVLVAAWNRRMIELFDAIESHLERDAVVELSGLKISRFSGFSLATSLSTELKLSPDCVEVVSLRQWAVSNKEIVVSRIVASIRTELPGYPSQLTSIATALSMQPANVAESLFIRIRAHIPEIGFSDLRLSVGCRACGKASVIAIEDLNADYTCESCAVVNKPEAKFYLRFKCTDGTGTVTLDAYTKHAEKLLQLRSVDFHGKNEEERRNVLFAAEAKYRANPVELILAPAKSLLINNKKLKWILRDVVM